MGLTSQTESGQIQAARRGVPSAYFLLFSNISSFSLFVANVGHILLSPYIEESGVGDPFRLFLTFESLTFQLLFLTV